MGKGQDMLQELADRLQGDRFLLSVIDEVEKRRVAAGRQPYSEIERREQLAKLRASFKAELVPEGEQ
jgi:hypothetical protein